MSVRETLELDITDALAEVARFGDQLENVAKAFGETLETSINEALENIPIVKMAADSSEVTTSIDEAVAEADDTKPVGADATEVTSEIDAAIGDADDTKLVTADASDVTAEIDAAVEAAVDELDVTVEVTADVSAAQAEIDGLADSLGGVGSAGGAAAEGLDASTVGAAALGRASAGTTGIIGKASAGLAGLSSTAVVATGAVGGLVAGAGFLYNAAFENVAVTQAWERSLGPLGDRILDLDSGTTGFRGNLRQLAQDVGSSDEAVMLATQRFVSFQQAAGIADDAIVDNTQNMAALAAQIRTTNPQLGSMDEIISALSRGLQRGGPRMQQFGLDLNAAEIEARALALSGKEVASELTAADKSVAGLQLALEQLQPDQRKVAEGMENVAIKSDRAKEKIGDAFEVLGEALVEPITDLLLELAKGFEEIANVVAKGLPYLTDFLGEIKDFGTRMQQDEGWKGFLAVLIGVADFQPDGQSWREYGQDVFGATDSAAEGIDKSTAAVERHLLGWVDTPKFVTAALDQQQRDLEAWYGAINLNTRLAGEAFQRFLSAAITSIPSVTSEFQKLSKDMGTRDVLANLETMFAATQRWTDDMEAQVAAGNTNIVDLMLELGPEKSAILIDSYNGDLADLDVHLEEMFAAEQNAKLRARQATVRHYLIAKGLTKEGAEEVVAQLGNSLLLEDPTLEAVEAAEDVIRDSKLAAEVEIAMDNAVEGARQRVDPFTQVGRDLMQGLINGWRAQGAAQNLAGEGTWAVETIYKAAALKAVTRSPSKLFAELGADLVAGLAQGMTQSAGLLTVSGESLVSVAAAPASAFTTTMQPAPTVAGANISVTVPVTVTGGMTPEDGRRIGQAAGVEVRNVLMMEARVA